MDQLAIFFTIELKMSGNEIHFKREIYIKNYTEKLFKSTCRKTNGNVQHNFSGDKVEKMSMFSKNEIVIRNVTTKIYLRDISFIWQSVN